MFWIVLFFTMVASFRVPEERVNTLLMFLPPIYKLDAAGIEMGDDIPYVNDSVTKSYLNFSIPHINDTLFSNYPITMTEALTDIYNRLNSTIIPEMFVSHNFTYTNLFKFLNGAFRGMLQEIRELMQYK